MIRCQPGPANHGDLPTALSILTVSPGREQLVGRGRLSVSSGNRGFRHPAGTHHATLRLARYRPKGDVRHENPRTACRSAPLLAKGAAERKPNLRPAGPGRSWSRSFLRSYVRRPTATIVGPDGSNGPCPGRFTFVGSTYHFGFRTGGISHPCDGSRPFDGLGEDR